VLAGDRLGGNGCELLLLDEHRPRIGLLHNMPQKIPCSNSRVAAK
jgi:hypothetical protein